jgi:hypothetical protein
MSICGVRDLSSLYARQAIKSYTKVNIISHVMLLNLNLGYFEPKFWSY